MRLLFKTIGAEQIDLTATFSFGRTEADVSFPDDQSLAAIHGQFIVEGDKGFIMDNGSATGTFVNGIQVPANQKIELQEGDCIRFGAQIVYFTKERKFKAIPGEETLVSQTGKELLAKAKKIKEAKLKGIEQNIDQTKIILKKLNDDLDGINNKITLAQKAIEEAEKRQQEYEIEIQHLSANKDAIRKSLDDKKIPLVKLKLNLDDKLQLLDLTQAPDSEKQTVQVKLQKIVIQITALDDEKKELPIKIVDLKQKAQEIEKKIKEYMAQFEKLNQAMEERQAKYAPEIKRLQEELKSLEISLVKARESMKR
ncbi:MAG: FHA domain-containing protein [Bdellovibrio sp.]|nr:FHA domain-containing protein [Bdellovibrio sp.]